MTRSRNNRQVWLNLLALAAAVAMVGAVMSVWHAFGGILS